MTERKKLLDHWLPPEGAGRPVACIATTFMFEPDFFEGDCLGRFLNLDSKRGEGSDLAYLIEEEERLAEASVALIADRSVNPENRNLRWDLLSVPVPRGGLMHAKVAVLAWENLVRFIVGSANITRAGYRSQLEASVVLDASPESEIDPNLYIGLVDLLVRLVGRAPGATEEEGPKRRALNALDQIRRRVRSLATKGRTGRARLHLAIAPKVLAGPSLPVLSQVWSGGPPRAAWILSPYYDETHDGVRETLLALASMMAQRGARSVTFVVPVENVAVGRIARAPRSLGEVEAGRLEVAFAELDPSETDERRSHAKVLLLESESWVAAMVGSSNFSQSGLGLSKRVHLEVNVAIGAPASGKEGAALRALIPVGNELEPTDVDWEMPEDEDEAEAMPLPEGFAECLVDPSPNPTLILRFDSKALPSRWKIALPSGQPLLSASEWAERGSPPQVKLAIAERRLPFWLHVSWLSDDVEWTAGWPVNVTEPAKLPPPEELRDLPVDAVLEALASTRPMHEAVVSAIRRAEAQKRAKALDPDLDPLKRYSNSGFLLHRARSFSAALVGLRRRLERPAASLDTLDWRLTSRFGPLAIAQSIAEEATRGERQAGEAAFQLAELALTLSRVNWDAAGRMLPQEAVRARVTDLIAQVETFASGLKRDQLVDAYVREALAEARG